MAAAVKIAAFAAMARFYQAVAAYLQWDFVYVFAAVAVLTILVGTFAGLVQSDVKRMLAYSSIAHAGFILMGILAIQKGGTGHVLFYTLGYGLATVGAFGVVALVRIGVHILRQQGDGVPDRDDTFDKLVNWVIGIFLGAGAVAILAALGLSVTASC